jgi:hypothetical protein
MNPLSWVILECQVPESLWLERDDETALIVRQRWVDRARLRASSVNDAFQEADARFERIWTAVVAEMAKGQRPPVVAHPLGHHVEHWNVPDEQTVIANLTSFDTYEGDQ